MKHRAGTTRLVAGLAAAALVLVAAWYRDRRRAPEVPVAEVNTAAGEVVRIDGVGFCPNGSDRQTGAGQKGQEHPRQAELPHDRLRR